MKIFMNVFQLFLIISINLYGHDQNIHQYITREAFKLLKKSFPTQLSELENYIGTNEIWSGSSADGSFGALKVVSGAYLEDEYDVVYGYGLIQNPDYRDRYDQSIPANTIIDIFGSLRAAHTTISHFWHADDGEYAYTRLFDDTDLIWWVFTIPENAMQKMRKYCNGLYNFIWAYNNDKMNWSWCGGTSMQFMTKFNIPPVIDFYKSIDVFQANKYKAENLFWYDTDCPAWDQSFTSFHKAHSCEILGRMCHLLEDMSVPAHVHCNSHAGPAHGMYEDYYEKNASSFHMWTADEIYSSGQSFINPFNSWNDPLYYLMYFMNQATDHYASGRTDGNDIYNASCPGLSQVMSTLGAPTLTTQINEQNCRNMHDKLFPLAIRTTAGLLYWFAKKTGILLTTSGELECNEEWSSNTLSGNVTVPSGFTLTINPGATVNFGEYCIIVNPGGSVIGLDNINCIYIDQSGTRYIWGSIQKGIDISSSGQTVKLLSRTYTENINLKSNITISGNGAAHTIINGLVAFNADYYSILENVKVDGDLRVWYGGHNQVNNSEITGIVSITNDNLSRLHHVDNTTSSGYGITAGYSTTDIEYGEIRNKTTAGINGDHVDLTCSWITLCNNNSGGGKDVISMRETDDIYLHSCLFSSSTEGSTISGPGDVYWDYWAYCSGMAKAYINDNLISGNTGLPSILDELSENKKSEGREEFKDMLGKYKELRNKIFDENKNKSVDTKKYKNEIESIAGGFKSILEKYPGSYCSLSAFHNLVGCYRLLGKTQTIQEFADGMLADNNYSGMASNIKLFLLPAFVDENNYQKMLEICDEVIDEIPLTAEAAFALYNKAVIYETFLVNKSMSDQVYSQLLTRYPNSIYAYLASNNLGKQVAPQNILQGNKITGIEIFNYPNPFNPSTTINYSIPGDGMVVLKVYDILGREVRTLVNDFRTTGNYSVIWYGHDNEGRDVSSGIYFYSIRFIDNVINRKMLLLR